MSHPQQTEARTEHPIVDPATGHAPETLMPSQVAPPTRSTTEPQQDGAASTQPGDGSHSQAHSDAQPTEGKVPWKDQVLGYAKVTRGKMLGKSETQDVGHQILQGEIAPKETHKSTH